MAQSPFLERIYVHPIKSLNPVSSETATVIQNGALQHDREWAIFDHEEKIVNAKRNLKVHGLLHQFDWESDTVTFQTRDGHRQAAFRFLDEHAALEAWLSEYFEKPVTFRRNLDGGYPDDVTRPGPTVISTATLAAVADWFPGLSVEEVRTRFRANLEIGGVPAFWEDRLVAQEGVGVRFQIGAAVFDGVNVCQRCPVPTRDTATGEVTPGFSNLFTERRAETLPPWATRERFNHFYRLSVNTLVPETEVGKTIQVGDPVTLRSAKE